MVRRIILVLTVAAVMAAMLVFSAGSAWAIKNPDSNGKPGPSKNGEEVFNCNEKSVGGQIDRGQTAGGGKKEGIPASSNCDHFYQQSGLIG